MIKKFNLIKKEYEKFSKELLKKGIPGYKETKKGIYGTMPCDEILETFEKIKLKQYKNFLDLGSGDGRVVLIASLFTNASGIEIDKELYKKAIQIKNKLKLKADFINDDYFNHDFLKYDLIFVNPDKGFHLGLEDKLLKEAKTVVVYNNIFKPRFLEKKKVFWIKGIPVYLFVNDVSISK